MTKLFPHEDVTQLTAQKTPYVLEENLLSLGTLLHKKQ